MTLHSISAGPQTAVLQVPYQLPCLLAAPAAGVVATRERGTCLYDAGMQGGCGISIAAAASAPAALVAAIAHTTVHSYCCSTGNGYCAVLGISPGSLRLNTTRCGAQFE